MDDHIQPMEDVLQPHSVLEVYNTTVCLVYKGIPVWSSTCFSVFNTRGVDSYYIDGVSLTHGAAERHQHIGHFAAGLTEVNNTNPNTVPGKCPCDISRNYDRVPAFVGNDY